MFKGSSLSPILRLIATSGRVNNSDQIFSGPNTQTARVGRFLVGLPVAAMAESKVVLCVDNSPWKVFKMEQSLRLLAGMVSSVRRGRGHGLVAEDVPFGP